MGICQSLMLRDQEQTGLNSSRSGDLPLSKDDFPGSTILRMLFSGVVSTPGSTGLKQRKTILNGYTQEELLNKRPVIYYIVVHTMFSLLRDVEDRYLRVTRAMEVNLLKSLEPNDLADPVDDIIFDSIEVLWEDEVIKEAYEKRNNVWRGRAAYFFNAIERIRQESYVPTQQDVLIVLEHAKDMVIEDNFRNSGVAYNTSSTEKV